MKALARRGCRVLAICRDVRQGEGLLREARGDVHVLGCDLSSLRQVRALADRIRERSDRLDVLVNNAAVVVDTYRETEDGLELQLAVNHVAPYLLTRLLLPLLIASSPARVVMVSSGAHAKGRIHFEDLGLKGRYGGVTAYRQSKLGNVLFARECARRTQALGVTVNSLNPGMIRTDIGSAHTTGWVRLGWPLLRPFQRAPEDAAAFLADLVLDDAWAQTTGRYFYRGRVVAEALHARSAEDALRLWSATEELVRPYLEDWEEP